MVGVVNRSDEAGFVSVTQAVSATTPVAVTTRTTVVGTTTIFTKRLITDYPHFIMISELVQFNQYNATSNQLNSSVPQRTGLKNNVVNYYVNYVLIVKKKKHKYHNIKLSFVLDATTTPPPTQRIKLDAKKKATGSVTIFVFVAK